MIQPWQRQVAFHAIRARVPFYDALRRAVRAARGYHVDSGNIRSTVSNLAKLRALMRENGRDLRGVWLEIGSGWLPIAPLVLRLGGADRVIMTDIMRNMDQRTFDLARGLLPPFLPMLGDAFGFDPAKAAQTLLAWDTPQAADLGYLAPFRADMVAPRSLAGVWSRACLEHIPAGDLETLLRGLGPKLAPGGIMAHMIDNGDHFAYVDQGLSRVNFLRWSDDYHAGINRLIAGGENRLRHSEYRTLFQRAGLTVASERAIVHEATRASLPPDLAPRFQRMDPDDLAALDSYFILTPERARP